MRIFLGAVAILFAALIVWAILVGDFWMEGAWLTSNPWGIVSLADLYIGFFLTALIIAGFEKPSIALFWITPLPLLGNVWALVWFAVRFPHLWRTLRSARLRP